MPLFHAIPERRGAAVPQPPLSQPLQSGPRRAAMTLRAAPDGAQIRYSRFYAPQTGCGTNPTPRAPRSTAACHPWSTPHPTAALWRLLCVAPWRGWACVAATRRTRSIFITIDAVVATGALMYSPSLARPGRSNPRDSALTWRARLASGALAVLAAWDARSSRRVSFSGRQHRRRSSWLTRPERVLEALSWP